MNSGNSEVRILMRIFTGYITDSWYNQPIVNWDNELILVPKISLSFRLDNVTSNLELKCKVLEWCSRHAHKTQFYPETKYVYKDYDDYEVKNYYGIKMNKAIYNFVLNGINRFLGTNFNLDEMEEIYIYLGNNINRSKAIKFIESNYDMNVLHSEGKVND